MSVYFNSANNLSGNITDCLYSDNTGIKHSISSIWGTKDNNVVKLWGKDEEKIDDPYAVGSSNKLLHWYYKLDETNNTVTLTKFKSGTANPVAYSSYELNGKVYRTKIGNAGANYSTGLLYNTKIVTVAFGNNIDFSDTTNISNMFYNCSALKSIDFGSNFNTDNVTDMRNMFHNCNVLENLDLSNFNTDNVIDMSFMFNNCKTLKTINLSNFNTNNVTDMRNMFNNCNVLENLDLSNFNTDNVTDMSFMFNNCKTLKTINLSNFNTNNVTDMRNMFNNCNVLENLDLSNFNTDNVTDMSFMFNNCNLLTDMHKYIEVFNMNNVKNMSYMFASNNIQNIDTCNWDIKNVQNLCGLFQKITTLKHVNMENLDVTNAFDFTYMFSECNSLEEVNLKNIKFKTTFDIGSHSIRMTRMFENCTRLESVDLTTWGLHKSTYMDYMFNGCSNLNAVYIDRNVWVNPYTTSFIFNNTNTSSFTYI